MSRENVEAITSVIEDFNRTGTFDERFERVMHPRIHFKDEIGAYDTRDELRDFLEGFAEAIGGLHVEVQEARDLGDRVMLIVSQSGRGTASEVPIAQPFTWVLAFEDGRCVRWRIYADHSEALEAVGLRE